LAVFSGYSLDSSALPYSRAILYESSAIDKNHHREAYLQSVVARPCWTGETRRSDDGKKHRLTASPEVQLTDRRLGTGESCRLGMEYQARYGQYLWVCPFISTLVRERKTQRYIINYQAVLYIRSL